MNQLWRYQLKSMFLFFLPKVEHTLVMLLGELYVLSYREGWYWTSYKKKPCELSTWAYDCQSSISFFSFITPLYSHMYATIYFSCSLCWLGTAYRWKNFGCRWKSLLCCPWGSDERLWLQGGCVERRCNNLYLVEWGSSILGWWGYIYFFAALFTSPFASGSSAPFYVLWFVCPLQKLNKEYLTKFWKANLIFHPIPGPVFQRVQRIWSERC